MAIEVFKLFGSIMVDNDKANKSISDTGNKAEGMGKKFLAGIGTVAKWSAALGAAAGAVSIGLAKMAEDLQQTQRKTKVIFGDMTSEVQAWSLENERTFGLGSGTIEKYVGGIADIVQGMGMAKDASFEMSKGVVTLGSQLANWGNVKADVAMEDVKRALIGSHDAVEKYGIKLNETVLNEYTRKEGLGDTFNKLNEAQKAQVRYAAILGSSQNAIDYWNEGNRSSTFYLNEMKEQLGNVGETLGAFVLPIFSKGVKSVADLASSFALFVGGIEGGVQKAVQAFEESGEPLYAIDTLFKEVFGLNLPNEIFYFIEGFLIGFSNLWATLTSMFYTIGVPLFDTIKLIVSTLIEHSQPVFNGISTAFVLMTSIIQGIWETVGKPMYDIIAGVIIWLGALFAQYYPQMAQIFNDFVNIVKSLWEGVLKPVFDFIGLFIDTVFRPIWDSVFTKIKDNVSNTFNFIIGLWNNSLKPMLQGIIDFVSGVFSGNWRQAFEGLGSIVSGVFNGLVSIVKSPINSIIGLVNKMIGGLNKIKLPDWVPGIGGMGINIPELPMLAKGTDYFRGGMAIVGEQGPELVTMPKGSKVTPTHETETLLNNSGATFVIQSVLDGKVISEVIAPFSDIVGGRRLNLSGRGVLV